MNEFMRRSRGAISIFLVIIMLPMMGVAGIFLDLSRTKLAQEVVVSSADLALNTTLTGYDKDLKDFYGLLASCQDTKDVIGVAKDYFVKSMKSTGVDTNDAGMYFDNIVAAFGAGDPVHDMLQISLEGEVDISATKDGALNNPALLKEGISEFMKYRSPVNGVADLFSKITESGVAEQLQDASAETKLIEARDAFNTAEKDLIKQAEKAYNAIKEYEKHKAHTGDVVASEAFLNKFSEFLMNPMKNSPNTNSADNAFENNVEEDFRAIYKHAHTLLTMNLFNTHNRNGDLSVTLLRIRWISNPGRYTTYSDNTQARASDIERLTKDLNNAISTYYSRRNTLQNAWNNIGSMKAGDYPIQYWVDLTDACTSAYNNYVSAASAVWKAGNKLSNALDYPAEEALDKRVSPLSSGYITMPTADDDGKVLLSSLVNAVFGNYESQIYGEVSGSGSSAYRNINGQIRSVQSHESKLKLSSILEIFNICTEMGKYLNDISKANELLKTAQTEVGKLSKKIETYKEAFDNWKTAAYLPELDDSTMATGENGDRTLIQELEQKGMIDMSKESVKEMKDRLGNVVTLFSTLEKDIKNIKYNKTPVYKLYKYKDFCSASGLNASSIPTNEQQLRDYAENTFSFSISAQIQTIVIQDGKSTKALDGGDHYFISDAYHPLLTKYTLDLYDWLENKFGTRGSTKPLNKSEHGFNVNDEDSAEEADETLTGKKDALADKVDTKEKTTGKNFSEWGGAALPSSGSTYDQEKDVSAKLSDAAQYVSDLFSNFGETFAASLENTRDDLFAEDYIFSMFTFDTFDSEGCYELLSDEQKQKITAKTADSMYSDVKDKWTGSQENMTLTLNPRNPESNWCYGGEVEYILYGNPKNSSNKNTVYANIFLIRYALDLKPIFDLYWKDQVLGTVALALEIFAYIPQNFTKTVACLAITAAEAGVDVAYLKEGIPVLIYKTSREDVFCNYKSVFLDKDTTSGNKEGPCLQYSDYLKMFLFIKFKTDENKVYLRTGDVIQANMTLASGKEEFALSKSQVFFTLHADVTVAPMWSQLLALDDLGDLSTSKGWRSISITTTSGY